MITHMLNKDEAGRIGWDEIFQDQLFQEVTEEQIKESLKSVEVSYKND